MAVVQAAGLTDKQILIVDRDVAAVEPLRHRLGETGFMVRVIADGPAAAAAVAERPPHLVILDWNMPGFAALEVIERARATRFPHPVRLIILSSLAGEHDVVGGLNIGADDFIAKPYSLLEAVARVCAVLRTRTRSEAEDLSGHVSLTAAAEGSQLRMVESRLLEFLRSHPGRTFNRAQLLMYVWGSAAHLDERTVDVNIQRLRKFLSQPGHLAQIETVRGFGYRFVSRESQDASQF
jgi:two-component system, OmpR family, phosphate regulon response regulator PhoB